MMSYKKLTVVDDDKFWDEFVMRSPYGHPMQLSSWAKLKKYNGWESERVAITQNGKVVAGAQVLFMRIPIIGYKMAYVPRGPVFPSDSKAISRQHLLLALGDFARGKGATLLRIEPALESLDLPVGWRKGKRQILHPKTSVVDLTPDPEDDILNGFKKDARYSIRRAGREGVQIKTVESAAGLSDFWDIYKETAERAGFGLYGFDYYKKVFEYLGKNTKVWIAHHQGSPVAFAWTAHVDHVAIYLYGGSNAQGRSSLANYLLQWEAIRYYRSEGVSKYDLNGHVNDGVSSFKNKFAHEQVSYVGTYDLPLQPLRYAFWETVLPVLTPVLRRVKGLIVRG